MDEIKVPMAKPVFEKEEVDGILNVVNGGWLGQGKVTQKFEKKLSEYFDTNVTAVNSGSSAIMCAMLAHDIKTGDKIIVPDFTFISTSSVPKILGAEVVPVDVDPYTLNIDLNALEDVVSKNDIKMVVFVDIAGLPNDLDKLEKLSKKYNFLLLEDAAEGLGSEYKNQKLGSHEHTSFFSFHIAKLITTVEGGCINTKNNDFSQKIKAIRDLGRYSPGYIHDLIGSNFRTTDINSVIGINQLEKIEQFLSRRINIANRFKKEIKNLTFQHIPNYVTKHSYMLFFGKAQNQNMRDLYVEKLRSEGIDARLSFYPLHLQPCNPELKIYDCPNSKNIYDTIFTLPMYNSLNDNDVDLIISTCNKIN
jgi:perosamine synthetase